MQRLLEGRIERMKEERQPIIAVVEDWGSVSRALSAQGAHVLDVDDLITGKRALKVADGIVFTGGGDVNPRRYGDAEHKKTSGISKDRDELEFALVKLAQRRNVPMMGICRGHQLINVALGGSLIQHVEDVNHKINHGYGDHAVKMRHGSMIGKTIRKPGFQVTSLHHQAVGRLGDGLLPAAWSHDGLIEMIESVPGMQPYVLGTQFHPEMDWTYCADNENVFKHFVGKCVQRMITKRGKDSRLKQVHDLLWDPIPRYTSAFSQKSVWWESPDYDDWDDWRDWPKSKGSTAITKSTIANCAFPPCKDPWGCAQWGDCEAEAVANQKCRKRG